MNIHGHEATRIHGTLQVELEGGGLALLEVDLDVSGHAEMGTEALYDNHEYTFLMTPTPTGHRHWVKIPHPRPGLLTEDGAMFRLRVPTT